MPTLYALKPAFQGRLRPLVNRLAAIGVTANSITILAAAMSIAAGAAIAIRHEWRWLLLLIPVVMFVRMALNAVDGMLAREHGQASTLGMYLNELCDVVSDLALILPFAVFPEFGAWGVVAFAISAVLTQFS
ncbi:CDP-alcohol phosphatidyltransferase family protein, partial [Mesorhizobium sp. M7A.F.Ca.CA.002.15.2.1]|uniref:CDP-alcohol phosphatidyltransferase family protein n=1 Tax=Mesorhizobium sp. M7A.F.Ca.CA.002.15.2.1 TaxID=2496678 RepID=UPI000FD2A341